MFCYLFVFVSLESVKNGILLADVLRNYVTFRESETSYERTYSDIQDC